MSQHFLRRGGRRYSLGESGALGLDPTVVNWALRVVQNGGTLPTFQTQQALSLFMQGLNGTGLIYKMLMVNCFVPDSLNACITPLIKGSGFDPWLNTFFVSGDLSVNGLIGNGSSKYLSTGMLGTANVSDTSAGMTLYVTNASPSGTYDMGYTNNAGSDCEILAYNNNGVSKASFLCWNNTAGQGDVTASWTPKPGYLSGNRTSANAGALYFATSAIAHSALATSNTTGGTRSANTIFVGNANAYQLGGPFGYTTNRYSFAAAHQGLTAQESFNFFTLVQAMRQLLGGGFV